MSDRNETIFSIGNGYLGTRGTFEEETDLYHNGTYINGFYETMPIVYGEAAYGYAEFSELSIVCAVQNVLISDSPYTVESSCNNTNGSVCFTLDARSDQEIELVKFIAYHTSDNKNDKSLVQKGINSLREAVRIGFDQIQKEQQQYLVRF